MHHYGEPKKISAFEAISQAQKIAFAPFIFQATRSLLELGILQLVENSGDQGIASQEIARKLDLTDYGVRVLLDMGLSSGLVWQKQNDEHFVLDKIGHFLLNDTMTRVNFNFTADVNYLGLHELTESVRKEHPMGLKVFSEDQETIYPILSKLPQPAQQSWFEFDHFYSDRSFDYAINEIFKNPPQRLLDIGGNTGKFILKCLQQDANVNVVLMDLKEQIAVAQKNVHRSGFSQRVEYFECNVLNPDQKYYDKADVIWMSQFLDCFSMDQIKQILKNVSSVMQKGTRLYILELFWDLQKFEPAALSLNAISLYFTALANGKSRMYHSKDLLQALGQAGLRVIEQTDNIGKGGHTLLQCEKINS